MVIELVESPELHNIAVVKKVSTVNVTEEP
jgi:hypothetical protein